MPIPADYAERVYAGWLGKCIGVRLGVPVEGWAFDEIARNLGQVTELLPLPPGKIFKPDDDTAVPMILIRALEEHGRAVTPEQIGETILNCVADERGTIWWGGYGVSTEHTTYANLAAGIPAPRSGSAALNGKGLAEQIGGQIFSDIWGLVAPGDPTLAAELAGRASRVTHDGEAVLGGRFVAALVSAAFVEADPQQLVEAGLEVIPRESEYARVVRAMRDVQRGQPDDWRAAYRYLAQNFGYDRYPGAVPIIPNAGVVALALLYGGGDFARAIRIATNAGWDTDCNAGNVGCIMGVAVGGGGIPERWREELNDVLVAASLTGARNLWTISAAVDLFVRLGRELADPGAVVEPPRARYHLDYTGATHGFQSDSEAVVALRQAPRADAPGQGALKVTVRNLRKKGELRVFTRTYLRPHELSANYYGASFSPQIYPGQTITAEVFVPGDAPEGLRAALWAWDDNHRTTLQEAGAALTPGRWQTLNYTIPPQTNALLSQVGVTVRNVGESWSGYFLLDNLDWQGAPDWSSDFALERAEYGAISQWTFLRGYWRIEEGGYHGSGPGICESYTGDPEWRDVELTVDLVPLLGQYHNVNLRVQGARRSYAVGLAEKDRLVLYKNQGGYRPVARAQCPWVHGKRYEIQIQAVRDTLAVRVDGVLRLEWRDEQEPYLHGQIGLSNWDGSHTRYERIRVRGAQGEG